MLTQPPILVIALTTLRKGFRRLLEESDLTFDACGYIYFSGCSAVNETHSKDKVEDVLIRYESFIENVTSNHPAKICDWAIVLQNSEDPVECFQVIEFSDLSDHHTLLMSIEDSTRAQAFACAEDKLQRKTEETING